MEIPQLDIQVQYPSELAGAVSFNPGYNWCDIYIRSNKYINTFVGNIVFEGHPYGRHEGILFSSDQNLDAGEFHKVNKSFNHSLVTTDTSGNPVEPFKTYGPGKYRVGLYVYNAEEDLWNEYTVYLTTELPPEDLHKKVLLDNGINELNVLDEGIA